MLNTIAIRSYRSLREVVLPLAGLTVVTGANGTGKCRCTGHCACSPTADAAR